MSDISDISGRTTGHYPLSIATSLALEGSLSIHPEQAENKTTLKDYDVLFVNIRTLFRNLLGSLEKDSNRMMLGHGVAAMAILDEMSMIEQIVAEETRGRTSVVFYYSNYNRLDLRFKRALLRTDSTDKQKIYTELHNKTMELVIKKHEKELDRVLRVFDLFIDPNDFHDKKTLMMSHFAIDLLNQQNFKELDLLESHTGKIKNKSLFYTKLHDGKNLAQIPFNKFSLTVFGDDQLFKPFNIKVRQMIVEVASKYNWTSVTTKEKIAYGLKTINDEFDKEILLEILYS